MYLQAIVALSLSIVQPFFCYEGVESSGNPIFEYLGMEPDSISEHELVEIDLSERSHKRGLGEGIPMTFQALGNDFRLWLQPTDDTFISDQIAVYRAEYDPRSNPSVIYNYLPDAMSNVGGILQDPSHLASVMLDSDDSGKTTVTAYLKSPVDNSPLTIRPLPAHVIREYMRKKRSIDDLSEDFIDSTYHVVLKLNNDKLKNLTMDVLHGVEAGESWDTSYDTVADDQNIDYQNEVPTLYPEMLVQTDESFGFNLTHRAGLNSALKYLLVFWNSVNLMYRQVEYPRIKLSIGGIIFGMARESMPFIADHSVRGLHGEDGFNSTEAIWGSALFYNDLKEIFPYNSYDLIATMSKRPMGTTNDFGILGVAYNGGTCRFLFTTIIRDNGAFNGIPVAAHELGHLFTLEHDEGPEGSECIGERGYIMSAYLRSTGRGFTFSPCSLDGLRVNFTLRNFSCLGNVPNGKVPTVPIPLPGKVKSLAEQCAMEENGGEPCDVHQKLDICHAKYCYLLNSTEITCNAFDPPLHGTPCIKTEDGKAGVCVDFSCVSQ